MIIGPGQLKKMLVRYNGIGEPITNDEREILLATLYNESKDRGGIAKDAEDLCSQVAASVERSGCSSNQSLEDFCDSYQKANW